MDLKEEEEKSAEYVIAWKPKKFLKSILEPLYNPFASTIKHFGYKIGIQFNNSGLVIERNNYLAKTINVYIVCYLDY